jgi:HK97 gp10 family phage protein
MSDIAVQLEVASKRINLFGKQTEDKLSKAMVRGALMIVRDAKINAPKDRGTLANSILTTPIEHEAGVLAIRMGPTVAYGAMVENGTVPHTNPQGSEDFVANMELWGRRKGMDDDEIRAIIEHIRKHGTKPHPYLGPAFYSNISAIKRDMEEAVKQGGEA